MRRGGGYYDQETAMDPIFMEAPRSPYGEFPNDEHATAKPSGPCKPVRQEAQRGHERAAALLHLAQTVRYGANSLCCACLVIVAADARLEFWLFAFFIWFAIIQEERKNEVALLGM